MMDRFAGARSAWLTWVVLAAGAPAAVFGQAENAQVQLVHPAGGQPAPAFEVATIKPNDETRPGFNLDMNPEHFSAKHVSVENLISWAYSTKTDDQIVGGPGWIRTDFFDVQGKAAEADVEAINKLSQPDRIAQSRLLVQSLLADRFGLKVSFRTEDLPVYALTVAKDGPKIKQVEATPIPPGTAPGTQPPPGAHYSRIVKSGPFQYTASAWPMNLTADWLSRFDEVEHRPVVDETGLTGTYDFVLDGVSMQPTTDESVTSIFTALEEQAGLKLVPKKAPVEVLVIEHVEKPSAN